MITGNESAYPLEMEYEIGIGQVAQQSQPGMTIFQYLSAKFLAAQIAFSGIPYGDILEELAEESCNVAHTLIAEWNKREKKQQ